MRCRKPRLQRLLKHVLVTVIVISLLSLIYFRKYTDCVLKKNAEKNLMSKVFSYLYSSGLYTSCNATEINKKLIQNRYSLHLNEILIIIKTTKIYHSTRMDYIIKTWYQLAKTQVSEMNEI